MRSKSAQKKEILLARQHPGKKPRQCIPSASACNSAKVFALSITRRGFHAPKASYLGQVPELALAILVPVTAGPGNAGTLRAS